MDEHDGWMWQGRQTHGWFGHGTKPHDFSGHVDPVGTLDQRIASLPLTLVAALPSSKRHHRSAWFEGAAAGQLVRAMTGWVSAIPLGETDFAALCFGSKPDRSGVQHFRNASSSIATAATFAEMREAADELAAGMQEIGLDHWPIVLRGAAERAGNASAGIAGLQTSSPGEVTRVFRIGRVRISGGSADVVAGPMDGVRGVATPTILEVQEKIERITDAVAVAANKLVTRGMSPRMLGTMLHTMFKNAVDEAKKRGELPASVRTEQTWANGQDRKYGEKGAFRTDVILMEGGRVIAIWDYKTGAGPTISERRVDDLRKAVTPPNAAPTVHFKVLHVPFYGRGS